MLKQYLPTEEAFDFDDVMLVPKQCVVKSRSEVTVTHKLGNHTFKLPIIPANMSTIVNEKTCEWLAEQGYFYVMHRFDVDPVAFTKTMHNKKLIASVSFGIKQADYNNIERFLADNITPEFITVDVAHGDSQEVERMVRALHENLPEAYIIAGNLATVEGALRLAEAGADAVKVGIGPGLACTTAPTTGFGSRGWQLSSVAHIADALANHPTQIIADGGIRDYGHIAKAIAFGADFVMIGSLLGGHDENPGEVVEIDGEKRKAYFGSASEHQKGENKHVEGRKLYLPYKGSLKDTLRTVEEHLQSSVSYAGGKNLLNLREVQYVRVP